MCFCITAHVALEYSRTDILYDEQLHFYSTIRSGPNLGLSKLLQGLHATIARDVISMYRQNCGGSCATSVAATDLVMRMKQSDPCMMSV